MSAAFGRVLVTGASRGVGRACAQEILGGGERVVGAYRRREDLARTLAACAPEQCDTVAGDLTRSEGRARVVEACQDGLTGAVLSAGVAVAAPFEAERVDGEDPIRHQLRADLEAPLLLLRELLVAGCLLDGASVVFVGSNLARRGLGGKVAYSAAKAGLEGATRALARELGPRGVRVNAVAPGLLRTDMTQDRGPEAFAQYATEVPLGRVGTPLDVARVVTFLLSDAAAYLTGQILDIDGGWSC